MAYSSARTPKEGTTNLHVDISDAVNLLIYAAELKTSEKLKEMLALVEKCGCPGEQIERMKNGETPGALWHLFKPRDADEIRSFLVKVGLFWRISFGFSKFKFISQEELIKGKKRNSDSDPIHDQVNYIDDLMLKRLENEHGVKPYTIVQFLGDAIFIPAGAPHQVRNLNSCIKVALDFVSAQGIDQCLLITDQLRFLSEKHSNREDKLQVSSNSRVFTSFNFNIFYTLKVKNIIYHAVRKCLSVLDK